MFRMLSIGVLFGISGFLCVGSSLSVGCFLRIGALFVIGGLFRSISVLFGISGLFGGRVTSALRSHNFGALRTDHVAMEVHFGEAEVVGQVLARVFSSTGAFGFGVTVCSALGTRHVAMKVHFTVTNSSRVVFARFRSTTTTSFESSSLSDCLQFASCSSTPDVLMSTGVVVLAVSKTAILSVMVLVGLAFLMLGVPADRARLRASTVGLRNWDLRLAVQHT